MNTTEKLIESYRPALHPDTWNQVRDFVTGNVRFRYAPRRTAEAVARGLIVFTGFAEWVLSTGVGELDQSVLRADVIDAYTAFRHHEVEGAVAERERKIIRTIAGITNSPEKRLVSTTASPAVPYTREEQNEIRRWTEWQATESRRHECSAVAALGLGCGLAAVELMQVRRTDIVTLEDGLLGVTVAGREVPVLSEWHDELATLRETAVDGYLLGRTSGQRNAAGLREVMVRLGAPRPSAQRMRVTWLLAHVDGNTPIPNLLEAAGLDSPDVLRRLLPFAARFDGVERISALRLGTEVAR